jgi:hypothetical protein
MNQKQLVVLWVTVLILVILAIFPVRRTRKFTKGRGRVYYHTKIDLATLMAELIPIALVGTGVIIFLKDKKD